jgi:hypothetical protein
MVKKRKDSGWTNENIIEHYRPELLNQQKTEEKSKQLEKRIKQLTKESFRYEDEGLSLDKEHSAFCLAKMRQKDCQIKETRDEKIILDFINFVSNEKDDKKLLEMFNKYKKENYL